MEPLAATYPGRLVPLPSYRKLENEWLTGGLLLRRTSRPGVLDSAGQLLPDQLSSPNYPEDLARHFSVNLLGNFQVADAAWKLRRDVAERLAHYWLPGEEGILPTHDEAEYLPTSQWDYYWLSLQAIDNCQFTSGGESFTCYVRHAPTRCNYWHFELHFHNQGGDVYALESKQRKPAARKIRAWLQDYVFTNPPQAEPTAAEWPEAVYIVSDPITPKL